MIFSFCSCGNLKTYPGAANIFEVETEKKDARREVDLGYGVDSKGFVKIFIHSLPY